MLLHPTHMAKASSLPRTLILATCSGTRQQRAPGMRTRDMTSLASASARGDDTSLHTVGTCSPGPRRCCTASSFAAAAACCCFLYCSCCWPWYSCTSAAASATARPLSPLLRPQLPQLSPVRAVWKLSLACGPSSSSSSSSA